MRKIYSLVLLAAALLVGTNAWAVDVVGNDRAALQSAINGVTGKQTVTLTLQNNITLDGPIWLGTEYLTDTQDDYAKSIILDLNGHSIEMVGTGSTHNMFVLTRGELLVRNSSATESQIILSGSSNDGSQIFSVYGSYRSSRWNADGTSQEEADSINTRTRGYVSHLEIGERVKIIAAANCLGTGIAVDALHGSSAGKTAATYYSKTLHYFTDVFGSNHGFAYGVRVDLYGDIEMIGISSGTNKAYGIKVNGGVRSPKETQSAKPLRTTTMDGSTNNYLSNYDTHREGHKLDTIDVPFVYVHDKAKVQTNSGSTKSAAIYASGYAKWLIEGHCEGNIGVSVSSGSVEFHDAVVVSTAENYSQPNGGGSVSGSGSAIVVNSRDAYPGDVEVTIAGDSRVTATSGYAIEEVVKTSSDTTKVETITIEGGTIEGGGKGAIVVSEKTIDDPKTDVTVYGGNISGIVNAGKGDIKDILPDGGSSTTAHVTTVTDPATGKTTIVVSKGAAPTGQASISAIETAYDESTTENRPSIKVTGSGDLGSFTKNIELKELELNLMSGTPAVPVAQICTIPNGVTLTVGRVVMGTAAKIIVEPGGKFIVTGDQGIVAPKTSNIILRTSETAQAIFLFHPNVTSNRHPNATVEFQSKSYRHRDNPSDPWTYVYQFFGSPMDGGVVEEITSSTGTAHYSQFDVFRVNAWDRIGILNYTTMDYSKFNIPFGFYSVMGSNDSEHLQTYTMKGALVGNINPNVPIYEGWSGVSNAYMGKLDIEELLDTLKDIHDATGSNIEGAVYLYNEVNGHLVWRARNAVRGTETVLDPLKPFMFHNVGAMEQLILNYKDLVWDPANKPASAPARGSRQSDVKRATIRLTDEDGVYDYMTIAQSNEFSSGHDFYDAEKYLNDYLNFYAMDEAKMDILSTDDIENTYLGFSCVKGGTMTLSFDCIERNDLVLLDLVTNAIIAMVPGQTYQFTVADDEANDYRFKIIGRQEMPTDIETVEQISSANGGIYTITGQYMGEMNEWNNLPAGLYIVNGEKKVK